MYDIPFDKTIQNVVTFQAHTSACIDTEKEKKLLFLTRQLELLSQKQFSMNDNCFALQSYSKCNYEQLRDFLELPCKHKLQYITSSIDKDQVLRETFDKVQTLQQKNVFLLVDEVQIRPTASLSLTIPHVCTFDHVRCGLCFIKEACHRACCQKRLLQILLTLASLSGIDIDCPKMFRRLANVLLNGLHNLEKDQQKNAVLLQTSIKKARLAD
ncbi:hypothetical protein FHG87_017239 [Trinorchestia longiramus]|nr:hypothetical protein FHG87_017239 [Trinorchestia longiramus]